MAEVRRATVRDIPRLMEIRFAVKENRLSNPNSVTGADCEDFIQRGLIWVVEERGRVVGFSAADDRDGTIWALFIEPPVQGWGLGAGLLALACNDLAAMGYKIASLSTDTGTRADRFYRRHGWVAGDLNEDGELQFQKELWGSGDILTGKDLRADTT